MKRCKLVIGLLLLIISCHAYEVMLFSDVHYDSPEVRVEGQTLAEGQQKAFTRNLTSWEGPFPGFLAAAGERSRHDVSFAVILGDLVHGYCGSPELHAKALTTVLDIMSKGLHCPMYFIKGNHDTQGQGGRDAFEKAARPYLQNAFKQTGKGEGPANYVLQHEQDLFIFFDCMEPDLEFLKKSLAAAPAARHVFFLIHYPVLPSSPGGSVPIMFGSASAQPKRQELLQLLAQRQAIVLCGHIHNTTYSRYKSELGTVSQLSLFSLVPAKETPFVTRAEGDGEVFFTRPGVAKAIEQQTAAGKVLEEYRGKLVAYGDYAAAAGYVILQVEDASVQAHLHYRGQTTPAKTIMLKP